MCYSAQVIAEYKDFCREVGTDLNIHQYARFFWEKKEDGTWRKIPKGMRDDFAKPETEEQLEITGILAEGNAAEVHALEVELFKQKKRVADAERALAVKVTKRAENEQRIAVNRLEAAQRGLADLRRKEPLDRDSRIYPGQYAPVMVMRHGAASLVPMRYQCRLPGWNEIMERKYPGTYNARRDNLEGAWKKVFGFRHGIMIVKRFYENVSKHKVEHRDLAPGEQEENVVLEFNPSPPHNMLIACLWDYDERAKLFSFAAITDEPPPEIAAAGHDRCIIPIKHENLQAWLNPDPNNLAALYAILDDRERPYYEHRLAA